MFDLQQDYDSKFNQVDSESQQNDFIDHGGEIPSYRNPQFDDDFGA